MNNPQNHLLFTLEDSVKWKKPESLPIGLRAQVIHLQSKYGLGPFIIVGVRKIPILNCVCGRYSLPGYEAGADHFAHPEACYKGHPQQLDILVDAISLITVDASWFEKA